MGLTDTAVPLVAAMLPGVITPDPPLNTPVKLELDPDSMVAGLAAKLEIDGDVPVDEPLPEPHPARLNMATPAISATANDRKFRFTIALATSPTEFWRLSDG